MQRFKDWMSGSSSTPPSTNPSHSPTDDLRHAGRDVRHAAEDVGADVKAKAGAVGQAAHGAAVDARDMAADAAYDAKEGLSSLGDRAAERWNNVTTMAQTEFDRLRERAAADAARARQEAAHAKEEVREAQVRATRRIKEATSTKIFANYRAPWYRDVNLSYDATFGIPAYDSKKVVITTPELLPGYKRTSLRLSSVHDSNTASEQVVANLLWSDTFNENTKNRSSANKTATTRDGMTRGSSDVALLDRPQHVSMRGYLAVPASGRTAPLTTGTMRIETDIEDVLSGCKIGGWIKHQGTQWLAGARSRLPYVTVSAYAKSDPKMPDRCRTSAAAASTLFRDTARGSTLNAGVQVDSAVHKMTLMPDAVSGMTAKLEYEEPEFNIDARVVAHQYTDTVSHAQTMKISRCFLRGLYVFNMGKWPRTAVGATVGVIDGGDKEALASVTAPGSTAATSSEEGSGMEKPASRVFEPYGDPDDPLRAQRRWLGWAAGDNGNGAPAGFGGSGVLGALNKPVGVVHVDHALNRAARLKFSLSSERQLHSGFSLWIAPGVQVQTSLQTTLPSFNPSALVGGQVKNSLGVGITIEG